MSIFDSRTHAADVKVYGVPRAKFNGLTPAQQKGLRVPPVEMGARSFPQWGDGVMSPKAPVQPVKTGGGGLPPAVIVTTGKLRSRNHRRRSPKMGPQNPIFHARIPTQAQYRHDLGSGKLAHLRRLYLQIKHNGMRVSERRDNHYEHLRQSFIRLHEERRQELLAMERQVDATVKC